ncbi:short-chain dehydrogenase [Spirochaetia bacterium]|nr:short-chain dehydrogenase [Spirochaetia bacterium]
MTKNIFMDRVAVVTGGGSGIGKALSFELASRGAKVVIADINSMANDVVTEITNGGGIAKAILTNIAIHEQVEKLIKETVDSFGSIDFMFNNAGIALVAEIYRMDIERWKKMIDINLMGVIYGTHYAYKQMCEQRSGYIINTASLGGLVAGPLRSAYCTGKFGVVGLTLALRTECRKYGINASLVCPGAVKTPIFKNSEMIGNDREKTEKGLEKTKMLLPEVAAKKILNAVSRNKAIIIMDSMTKILWYIFRVSPSLFEKLVNRLTVAK